jgi:hypothetical protein
MSRRIVTLIAEDLKIKSNPQRPYAGSLSKVFFLFKPESKPKTREYRIPNSNG